MSGGRKALVVATYDYRDTGLRRLAAPEHDAESFAAVLEDPASPASTSRCWSTSRTTWSGRRSPTSTPGAAATTSTLLYFSGHGLKDDEGRLHLAMTNTRREALLFTAISAAQLNDAMDASASRRKVLILDCCYSGAFPAGRAAKADEGVHTLERFQGKGRAVLTASDATQYAFEGDTLSGSGSSSVFTRYLVEAIRSGAADLDEDGDIALDELYSYVHERVVAEMPQQRPKKQEDVDGRILIARNVHWTLPAHLRHAIESPIAAQRLSAVDGARRTCTGSATTWSAPPCPTARGARRRRQPVGVGGSDGGTGADPGPRRRPADRAAAGRPTPAARRTEPLPPAAPAPAARRDARARGPRCPIPSPMPSTRWPTGRACDGGPVPPPAPETPPGSPPAARADTGCGVGSSWR